jgi:CRISPR-associated protein Csx17
MSSERHVHRLEGCLPVPLASYLKALGVLRLVSEQADSLATGWWSGDVFHLECNLDRTQLERFFLDVYRPTPLVGPWGARSGFFGSPSEKSARESLDTIQSCGLERLSDFASAIEAVYAVLKDLQLTQKADSPEDKRRLMMQCRAVLPDAVLRWLDATYVLLEEDTKYPPLLGTGGNEGSGSYMSGFAQQVVDVVVNRRWDHALAAALHGVVTSGVGNDQTPGHFSPEASGGPNSVSGFSGKTLLNPWDYILTLEGTLLFSAAAVRRLESRDGGALAFPFCVKQSGVGYPSAAGADEETARGEMWMPLWTRAAGIQELEALFTEGRAQVDARRVRNGVDFARAIADLGTDRGISAFERYGFQQRNGLSCFAVSIGRFGVHRQQSVALLGEFDQWLDAFRRQASGDKAPASAARALRRLEQAIIQLCRQHSADNLQTVLICLGNAQQTLATSVRWRTESFLRPVPLLSPEWLTSCDDDSAEYRLAASLASLWSREVDGFRQYIDPVVVNGGHSRRWVEWSAGDVLCDHTWTSGTLQNNLLAVLRRRVMQSVQGNESGDGGVQPVFAGRGAVAATPGDLALFLNQQTDDTRIECLLRGLCLLDWSAVRHEKTARLLSGNRTAHGADSLYTLLKLCHHPDPIHGVVVRLDPAVAALASAGKCSDAIRSATRRLIGSGLPPRIRTAHLPAAQIRRIASALLFPVSTRWLNSVSRQVLMDTGESAELPDKSATPIE